MHQLGLLLSLRLWRTAVQSLWAKAEVHPAMIPLEGLLVVVEAEACQTRTLYKHAWTPSGNHDCNPQTIQALSNTPWPCNIIMFVYPFPVSLSARDLELHWTLLDSYLQRYDCTCLLGSQFPSNT